MKISSKLARKEMGIDDNLATLDIGICVVQKVTCENSVFFSGFLHPWNGLPWYNWNIVESGITLTQKPFLITRHNLTKGYSYHYIYNDDSYHCKNIKCLHCHSFCILKKKKKLFERQYKWFPFTYLRDVFSASNLDASNNKATTLE